MMGGKSRRLSASESLEVKALIAETARKAAPSDGSIAETYVISVIDVGYVGQVLSPPQGACFCMKLGDDE
jgi:hypothetical protein